MNSPAMKICAERVRELPDCKQCLHYGQCKQTGVPASRLGRFHAKMITYDIPLAFAHAADVANYNIAMKTINLKDTRPHTRKTAVFTVSFMYKSKWKILPVFETDTHETLLARLVAIMRRHDENLKRGK